MKRNGLIRNKSKCRYCFELKGKVQLGEATEREREKVGTKQKSDSLVSFSLLSSIYPTYINTPVSILPGRVTRAAFRPEMDYLVCPLWRTINQSSRGTSHGVFYFLTDWRTFAPFTLLFLPQKELRSGWKINGHNGRSFRVGNKISVTMQKKTNRTCKSPNREFVIVFCYRIVFLICFPFFRCARTMIGIYTYMSMMYSWPIYVMLYDTLLFRG